MFDKLFDASFLVHAAALTYIIGFLIRDQLVLRLLVLLGTTFYIAYYYLAPATPLWDAIIWSILLGLANLLIILQLAFERTTFAMSEEERELYGVFDTMTPGEFRKVLKLSAWETLDENASLAVEGEPLKRLYYILEGNLAVQKNGTAFVQNCPTFVGEVAFFLKTAASASVKVKQGSRLVYWETEELEKLQRKQPGIRAALHGILNSDMAQKVARSVGADVLS